MRKKKADSPKPAHEPDYRQRNGFTGGASSGGGDDNAEVAALACVFTVYGLERGPERATEFLRTLEGGYFENGAHRAILAAMKSALTDALPIDEATIFRLIGCRFGPLISKIADSKVSPAGFNGHLQRLRECADTRERNFKWLEARGRFEDGESIEAILSDLAKTEPSPLPHVRSIKDLVTPEPDSDSELLRYRYLCRRGGALWVGNTGIGKSSLAVQAAILWALGRPAFGIEPTHPLKSLVIQAENDDGDLAEMRDGIFAGLNLSTEDRETVGGRVFFVHCNDQTGQHFLTGTISPKLSEVRPEVLWLDPLLAFLGADVSDQEAVSAFLRVGLNPLLQRHDCAAIILHHTPKPRAAENGKPQELNPAYAGAGSAELSNWPRAILSLEREGVVFALVAAKRGSRLRWRDETGLVFKHYLAHATDGIYWRDADAEQIASSSKRVKTPMDLLALVPLAEPILKSALLQKAKAANIGEKSARAFIDQLTADETLHVWRQRRPGTNPLILLSRTPQE